jgi:hypothetical protein
MTITIARMKAGGRPAQLDTLWAVRSKNRSIFISCAAMKR